MKITLVTMENYLQPNDSLFANVVLPDTTVINKDTLVNEILLQCGEFETLYADPNFEKMAVTNFFLKYGRMIKKWCDALELEYKPLENYNRTEEESYKDDQFEIHTFHEGERLTSETNGKTKMTFHEGERETNEKAGSTTVTTNAGKMQNTFHEGERKTTENDGTTNTIVNNGKTQTTKVRPDTTKSSDQFAGFSATGNSLTEGAATTTKIGNGSTGTYTETDTTEQITGTVTDYQMLEPHTVETGHIEGQDDTTTNEQITDGTSHYEMTTPHTIEVGHKADQMDTTTTEMLTPHTTETGHKADQLDTDKIMRNPRNLKVYGNVGVTTSQEMLEAELKVAQFNIYNRIVKLFTQELVLAIYI